MRLLDNLREKGEILPGRNSPSGEIFPIYKNADQKSTARKRRNSPEL